MGTRGTFNYADRLAHFDFDMHPFDYEYGTNSIASVGKGVHYLATDIAYNIEKALPNKRRR